MTSKATSTVALKEAERAAIAAVLRERGTIAGAKELGASRAACERAAAGLGIHRGTAVLLRQGLARLAPAAAVEP